MRGLMIAPGLPTIDIAVRRVCDGNGTPILFFYQGSELTCYQHVGQHSAADVLYMQQKTAPANPYDKDCMALVKEWESLGPDRNNVRFMKRLQRGKE
jgi:hypothetical protein